MAETVQQAEQEGLAHHKNSLTCPQRPVWAILLLVMAAMLAWGISVMLPARPPFCRIDTVENWLALGYRVLCDTLQAISILILAMVVSVWIPSVGLWIERLVFHSQRRTFLIVALACAVLSSCLLNGIVFECFPNIIDEIALVFQAKLLASGRLFANTPDLIDFFDLEFIVADGPRWYGKYFLGPSLAIVPGIWVGAAWLVNPLLGGVAILLVYAIGRNLLNEKIARVATVLMVISPFRVTTFATMMSHPVCLVVLGLFALSMIKWVREPGRVGWAWAAGASLGFAVNCRPLTAVMMGTVVGVAALYAMPWRQFRWQTLVAFMIPLAFFAAVFLGYNKALTGDVWVTPFTKWSPTDRLGFGPDMGLEYWPETDRGHTLQKALFKNSFFNVEGLSNHLTGWRNTSLVLLLWALFCGFWPKRTWALGGSVAVLMLAYLFYVTHSTLMGQPRYWSESMPMMFLLVAIALVSVRRYVPVVCRWLDIRPAVRTGRSACWLAGLMLTLWGIPHAYGLIINEWGFTWQSRGWRHRVYTEAKDAGLDHALIFIETGYYRATESDEGPDEYQYDFIRNDPDLNGPIIYARDLGERNAELMRRYPGRKAYRFVRGRVREEDRLVLISPEGFEAANGAQVARPE